MKAIVTVAALAATIGLGLAWGYANSTTQARALTTDLVTTLRGAFGGAPAADDAAVHAASAPAAADDLAARQAAMAERVRDALMRPGAAGAADAPR